MARRRRLSGLGDAGLPAGSQLVYNATWDLFVGVPVPFMQYGGFELSNSLASNNVVVDKEVDVSSLAKSNGFTLYVHTTGDFNSQADIKSIIDHFVYNLVGQNKNGGMPTSSIALASLAAPTPPPPGTTDPSISPNPIAQFISNITGGSVATSQPQSWIGQNWPWLVGGGVVFFLLREIL
jgi:hypothetical protein